MSLSDKPCLRWLNMFDIIYTRHVLDCYSASELTCVSFLILYFDTIKFPFSVVTIQGIAGALTPLLLAIVVILMTLSEQLYNQGDSNQISSWITLLITNGSDAWSFPVTVCEPVPQPQGLTPRLVHVCSIDHLKRRWLPTHLNGCWPNVTLNVSCVWTVGVHWSPQPHYHFTHGAGGGCTVAERAQRTATLTDLQ